MSANVSNTTTLVTCKSSKSGKTFLAGNIKNCIDQRKLLTSDEEKENGALFNVKSYAHAVI